MKRVFVPLFVLIVVMIATQSSSNKNEAGELTCAQTRVTLPDNTVITAEIARTDDERAKGLSNRTELAHNRGMLFLFDQPSIYPFWMKNTLIPLDIIWIKDNKVVETVTLEAQTSTHIPQHQPNKQADMVLELNKDQAAAHKLTVGSTIKIESCDSGNP
jgi:uncharacterized protein